MKVASYYGPEDIRCEEKPRPKVGEGEVLLRVRSCGLCGTDTRKMRYATVARGTVLGHEVAGEVVEAGAGVTRFGAGDRVIAAHHVPCFVCHWCRHGAHSQCESFRQNNLDPGGFAEFVRVLRPSVEKAMFKIPAGMSFEEASLVETCACCLRAVRLLDIQPGDAVVVAGAGPVGLIHVSLSRVFRAGRVVATDLSPWRRERALEFGATGTVDPALPDARARVEEACGGRGPDSAIVAAGSAKAIEQAISFVRPGGTVLVFADCPPGSTVSLDPDFIYHRGIRLIGSYSSTPAEQAAALDLMAAGLLSLGKLVTHRFRLDEMSKAVSMAVSSGESLKILMTP